MKRVFSRRNFLAITASVAAAVASPAIASTAEAEQRLKSLFNAMTEAVKLPTAARTARFNRILTSFGDMNSITSNALGRERRTLNRDQIREFSEAFMGYMAKKYGRLLAKQRISSLTIERTELKHDRRGTPYYEIRALVHRSGKGSVNATFKLNSQYRFYNMAIEGINMLLSERREIGELFDTHSFQGVLAELRK